MVLAARRVSLVKKKYLSKEKKWITLESKSFKDNDVKLYIRKVFYKWNIC
jgi:hypothetical protein